MFINYIWTVIGKWIFIGWVNEVLISRFYFNKLIKRIRFGWDMDWTGRETEVKVICKCISDGLLCTKWRSLQFPLW